jgi:hypothetical protein
MSLQRYFYGERSARNLIKDSFSKRYKRRMEAYEKFLKTIFDDAIHSVGTKRKDVPSNTK